MRAKDSDGKEYALKITNEFDSQTEVDKFGDQFNKELKLLSKLNHPNILRCHAGFLDNEQEKYVLVLDYMEGGNLTSFIKRATKKPE